ncbi:PTK9 protein tyrosine kinase 9 [Pseudohyphozyma bogoriensis]|nr:PTK9 protein tyrosine kinase 9 [Pseudohyphozyma bogoriensis]
MSTQSGIAPSPELQSTWAAALANPAVRLIKIQLEGESLVATKELESAGSFEEDFALLDQAAEEGVASYLLFRMEEPEDWIFYSFVPDHEKVRQKMLYASSRATLTRAFGDARFKTSIFATDKSDLTYSSYQSHLVHLSSDAPLTAREQEMAQIKAAEAATSNQAEERTDILAAGTVHGALEWTEQAQERLLELQKKEGESWTLTLEIDTKTEVVILADPQPLDLSLPTSSPSYTFYSHTNGAVVFIYCCPSSSPIRHRMLYSSSCLGVPRTATALGLTVSKKIETSDPSEVDLAFILAELGPLAEAQSAPGEEGGKEEVEGGSAPASGTSTPSGGAPLPVAEGKVFSKPARPGRRR